MSFYFTQTQYSSSHLLLLRLAFPLKIGEFVLVAGGGFLRVVEHHSVLVGAESASRFHHKAWNERNMYEVRFLNWYPYGISM